MSRIVGKLKMSFPSEFDNSPNWYNLEQNFVEAQSQCCVREGVVKEVWRILSVVTTTDQIYLSITDC